MQQFSSLYDKLDSTTSTNAKVAAMADYFQTATQADAAWALFFLTGRRWKRFISSRSLREWTLRITGIEDWLFQECYNGVGDSAECCALLLDSYPRNRAPEAAQSEEATSAKSISVDDSLSTWIEDRIVPLAKVDEEEQRQHVTSWWSVLDRSEIFILNKLLTGSFRVGVSQSLVARALAQASGLSVSEISHRLMGNWDPTPEWYAGLLEAGETQGHVSQPYPFYLASPIEREISSLGAPEEWQAEWKWDGIRAQLIRRGDEVFIWSRGEELITDRFPELAQAALTLPSGTVIDGEILAMQGDQVLPFGVLQKRIGRKTVSASVLREAPAGMMVYDLIEEGDQDLRLESMQVRRQKLEALLSKASATFRLSPIVHFSDWSDLARLREESRERSVEGIMLKRLSSPYQAGRKRGDWWKWKIDPLTIDAVLIYAQAGTGRRANLFTDYTFAVWDQDQLVPVAKAYSGLSDEEIGRLDHWIRRNTRDKFGPVRSVTPEHVFELAFEGINASPRHKSGVAVRFPRILRWRHDKKIQDADTLATLQSLIADSPAQVKNGKTTSSPQYDLARDTTT